MYPAYVCHISMLQQESVKLSTETIEENIDEILEDRAPSVDAKIEEGEQTNTSRHTHSQIEIPIVVNE